MDVQDPKWVCPSKSEPTMTDPISSYAKSSRSDAAMRASVGKADKQEKAASAAPAPASPSEGRRTDSVQMSNVAQKAMAEPDFDRAKVESIKQAISEEEELRWKLEAAKLRVEVWKTEEYTKRVEMKL